MTRRTTAAAAVPKTRTILQRYTLRISSRNDSAPMGFLLHELEDGADPYKRAAQLEMRAKVLQQLKEKKKREKRERKEREKRERLDRESAELSAGDAVARAELAARDAVAALLRGEPMQHPVDVADGVSSTPTSVVATDVAAPVEDLSSGTFQIHPHLAECSVQIGDGPPAQNQSSSTNNDNGPSQKKTRATRAAAAGMVTAQPPAVPRPRQQRKRNQTKRLTIMPGSFSIQMAVEIRKWRDWCESEYCKTSSPALVAAATPAHEATTILVADYANEDQSEQMCVDREVAGEEKKYEDEDVTVERDADSQKLGGGNDDESQVQYPASVLPDDPSVFDSLDSIIDAAVAVKLFTGSSLESQQINRDCLKASLVGSIQIGDYIEKVRHPSPSKRYRSQVFGQNRYLVSAPDQIETFSGIVTNPANYPLYITFCRKIIVPVAPPVDLTGSGGQNVGGSTGTRKRTHPVEYFDSAPAKRQKTDSKANEVICLLDSSDEEEESTESSNLESVQQQEVTLPVREAEEAIQVEEVDGQSILPTVPTHYTKLIPTATPDPSPAFSADDFVLTKYGPGKVICSRVDRMPESDELLVCPTLTYSIDINSGIVHVSSSEVQSIEGSEYANKRILTYEGVTINKMDLLRLWPLTYLNDSLINFYIKYLVKEKMSFAGSSLGSDDFHIFPTYFYTRLAFLENGGTAYRDNPSGRKKLFQDLKRWTKGFDIFERKFLIFPINYDLHWSFVVAANVGDALRMIPPPSPPSDEVVVVQQANNPVEPAIIDGTGNGGVDVERLNPSAALPPVGYTPVYSTEKDVNPSTHFLTTDTTCTAEKLIGADDGGDGIKGKEGVTTSTGTSSNVGSFGDGTVHTLPLDDGVTSVPESNMDLNIDQIVPANETAAIVNSSLAPCIIHFDSGKHFKLHRSGTVFKHIRKYLAACYECTKIEEFPLCSIGPKTLPGFSPAIPQQENAKDCGVYTLEMIERVLCHPPAIDPIFVDKKGKVDGSPFHSQWFEKNVIQQKRLDILQLIKLKEEEYFGELLV